MNDDDDDRHSADAAPVVPQRSRRNYVVTALASTLAISSVQSCRNPFVADNANSAQPTPQVNGNQPPQPTPNSPMLPTPPVTPPPVVMPTNMPYRPPAPPPTTAPVIVPPMNPVSNNAPYRPMPRRFDPQNQHGPGTQQRAPGAMPEGLKWTTEAQSEATLNPSELAPDNSTDKVRRES